MSVYLLDLIKNMLLISPVLTSHNVLWGFFFSSKVQGYRPTFPQQTEHSWRVLVKILWTRCLCLTANSNYCSRSNSGPLLAETQTASTRLFFTDLLVMFVIVMLFLYFHRSNLCDSGRTSKLTIKWAHPQLRWWWTNRDATQTPVLSALWIKPNCLGTISHHCSRFTQLGQGCRTWWSDNSKGDFLQLES